MVFRLYKLLLISTQVVFFLSTGLAQDNAKFILSSPGTIAQIVIDDREDALVHTAAKLFSSDIYNITGRSLLLNSAESSRYQIKIGTLHFSARFDEESRRSGIDIDKLATQWESFVLKTVPDPARKKNVLFVVGSNPRGTAYALMELSRMIGISPWCWWADVRPERKESVELPFNLFIQDGPKVKYRGIFLNDEDWGLQPWAARTFEPETGDIGPKTYEKIFELLLRLKANTIWPAMHPSTRAFYTIPGNQEMAAKYQIFIGTSHAEPMLRNNVGEWDKKRFGDYDYSTNGEVVRNYWLERIRQLTPQDKYIVTLGMRGIHDSGMQGDYSKEEKVEMLETIISDQRKMLGQVLKKDVAKVPQAFIPYKEVLKIYSDGARVPDDVTLVWPDDNHGYIRQLSTSEERKRSGGAGVYYHISYWGRPHDYLWLESIPVSLIWEEMSKAYQTGARQIWITNVGDIKPIEIGMSFFLEMAWDPEKFAPDKLTSYYTEFAREQFGDTYATEIGEILAEYFQLGFSRKPEHMGWSTVYPDTPVQDPTFSLFNNGDEAQQRIDAYNRLEAKTANLESQLPERLRDAFYQLVVYKISGASNMNKKLLYAYKSRVYAGQGRASANFYADKAREAFEKIREITDKYNQHNGGKWMHMMTYDPRTLPVYGMPDVGHFEFNQTAAGGIIAEGKSQPLERGAHASLPVFLSATDRRYFIDVFNSGRQPIKWTADPADAWVKLSSAGGETSTEERVWVSVDWSRIPDQKPETSFIKFNVGNSVYEVQVKAQRLELPADLRLFVEDNGAVAIEAEHYQKIENGANSEWKKIQGLGRENDAVGSFPATAGPADTSAAHAPALLYEFFTQSSGPAKLRFYCLPSQPVNGNYRLRFSVTIDDEKPVIVDAALKETMDEHNEEWQTNVLRAASIPEMEVIIPRDGRHRLKITMVDPGVILDKIEVLMNKREADSYFGVPETKAH